MTDITTVAYHEAGHAVVAALSPFHVPGETVLRVEPRDFGVSNGSSSYRNDPTIQRCDLWDWRVAAGGGAGELILHPKADVFGYGEGFACPTAGRLDLINCGIDLFDLTDDGDPEVALRREQRALGWVCRLVLEHAAAVTKIAAILLQDKRIDGATVQEIVGPKYSEEPKSAPANPRQLGLFGVAP